MSVTKNVTMLRSKETKLQRFDELGITPPLGKRFSRWTTNRNGSGMQIRDGATVQFSDNTTLYAQWEDSSCRISYTCVPFGGTYLG